MNLEKRNRQTAEWKATHREQERLRSAERYSQSRIAVLDAYGAKCACCSNTFTSHLTVDHVNGGGRKDRAQSGGNRNIYMRIRREGFPSDYQVLCFNCNHAKHVLGRCPCSD